MDVMVDIRFIESLQKIWLGKNACIPSRVNSLTPKNCQTAILNLRGILKRLSFATILYNDNDFGRYHYN